MRWWVVFTLLTACTSTDDSGDTDPDGGGDTDTDVAGETVRFDVVGFNAESGGSVPTTVDDVIAMFEGESLWGLCEVADFSAAETYVAAMDDGDQDWQFEYGSTGYSDRLVLAWDDDVWELVSSEELDEINVGGTVRSPLVGHVRHRDSGLELLFMVNHLWRTEDASRHEQAERLNAWGREQTLPVVAVGDYNFDWNIDGSYHDDGYDLMTEDDVWEWVVPDPLVKTQCSSWYDSVLDFTFVAGDARDWVATAEIPEIDNRYCFEDEDLRSDHRPVHASFEVRR